MRALNILMAFLFLVAAAVQYNDPDPFRWIGIYGAAGVACLWAAFRRIAWTIPAVIGMAALVWALTILPHLSGTQINWDQVFGTIEMANLAIEETREIGGLLIVALWMCVLAIFARKREIAGAYVQ